MSRPIAQRANHLVQSLRPNRRFGEAPLLVHDEAGHDARSFSEGQNRAADIFRSGNAPPRHSLIHFLQAYETVLRLEGFVGVLLAPYVTEGK